MGYYTNYYKLALVEKHLRLYSPCIETVDVQSKLVIAGLRSSSRVVEWGRDAVWAQPCSTSTSTSWQKLWTAPATSRASLYTTPKVKCLLYADDWFLMSPTSRGSPAQPGPAGTVLWGMGSDGQPGQNQSHGVPEEGQVSGKQITSSVTEEKFWTTAPATLTWASRSLASGASVWLWRPCMRRPGGHFMPSNQVWPLKTTN